MGPPSKGGGGEQDGEGIVASGELEAQIQRLDKVMEQRLNVHSCELLEKLAASEERSVRWLLGEREERQEAVEKLRQDMQFEREQRDLHKYAVKTLQEAHEHVWSVRLEGAVEKLEARCAGLRAEFAEALDLDSEARKLGPGTTLESASCGSTSCESSPPAESEHLLRQLRDMVEAMCTKQSFQAPAEEIRLVVEEAASQQVSALMEERQSRERGLREVEDRLKGLCEKFAQELTGGILELERSVADNLRRVQEQVASELALRAPPAPVLSLDNARPAGSSEFFALHSAVSQMLETVCADVRAMANEIERERTSRSQALQDVERKVEETSEALTAGLAELSCRQDEVSRLLSTQRVRDGGSLASCLPRQHMPLARAGELPIRASTLLDNFSVREDATDADSF